MNDSNTSVKGHNIIRVVDVTRDHFTMLRNDLLRDKDLKIETRGLLAFCLSHPPDFSFNMQYLMDQIGVGRDKILSMIKNAISAGYWHRAQIRHKDGKLYGVEHKVAGLKGYFNENQPQPENPHPPLTDLPLTVDPHLIMNDSIQTNESHNKSAREKNNLQIDEFYISGEHFRIDLKAVEQAAMLSGVEPERARVISEIVARDWIANDIRPANPMAVIRRAIQNDNNQGQQQQARIDKINRPYGQQQAQPKTTQRQDQEYHAKKAAQAIKDHYHMSDSEYETYKDEYNSCIANGMNKQKAHDRGLSKIQIEAPQAPEGVSGVHHSECTPKASDIEDMGQIDPIDAGSLVKKMNVRKKTENLSDLWEQESLDFKPVVKESSDRNHLIETEFMRE